MLPDVPVSWSGSDASSGIASYRIFVSVDGAPATLWLGPTTTTSATFAGTPGHRYDFTSIATRVAGHVRFIRFNLFLGATIFSCNLSVRAWATAGSCRSAVSRSVR